MHKITNRWKSELFFYIIGFLIIISRTVLYTRARLYSVQLLLWLRVMFWSPLSYLGTYYNSRCRTPTSTLVLLASDVSHLSDWTARSIASVNTLLLNYHVNVFSLINIWSHYSVPNGCCCCCCLQCRLSHVQKLILSLRQNILIT